MTKKIGAIGLAVALSTMAGAATAATVDIFRISDTQALLNVNDAEFSSGLGYLSMLQSVTPPSDGIDETVASSSLFGRGTSDYRVHTYDQALAGGGSYGTVRVNFGRSGEIGETIAGSLLVELTSGIWADVGRSGAISNIIGRWEMFSIPEDTVVAQRQLVVDEPLSAVPLPAGAPLLLAGLGALAIFRRKK